MSISVTNIIAIFLGSGIGAVFRYLIGMIDYGINFPCATLIVNILGSLFFGFIYAFCVQKLGIPTQLQLFLLVGFCGGFSTLSSFAFESLNLFEQGMYLYLILNILLSIILPLLAVFLGVYFGKSI